MEYTAFYRSSVLPFDFEHAHTRTQRLEDEDPEARNYPSISKSINTEEVVALSQVIKEKVKKLRDDEAMEEKDKEDLQEEIRQVCTQSHTHTHGHTHAHTHAHAHTGTPTHPPAHTYTSTRARICECTICILLKARGDNRPNPARSEQVSDPRELEDDRAMKEAGALLQSFQDQKAKEEAEAKTAGDINITPPPH
eukprot:1188148-Prorocentrum_minimum.AAC.1